MITLLFHLGTFATVFNFVHIPHLRDLTGLLCYMTLRGITDMMMAGHYNVYAAVVAILVTGAVAICEDSREDDEMDERLLHRWSFGSAAASHALEVLDLFTDMLMMDIIVGAVG